MIPRSVYDTCADEEWLQATRLEMEGHVRAGTYRIVDIPEGRKLIDTMITYTVKRDGRKKARWCIRGDRQVAGVDYGVTDFPVLRFDTILCLLNLAARYKAIFHTIDSTMAFVHALIDRPVFLKG